MAEWTAGGDASLTYVRKLGAGGEAEVYELRDTQKHRDFARKLIKLTITDTVGISPEITFLKEANHDNIIKLFKSGDFFDRGSLYIFIDMQLCDFTLEEYNKGRWMVSRFHDCTPQLKEKRIWTVMTQIANGLHFVHSKNFVHRDLKPRNVLYSCQDEAWKLADFGITCEGGEETMNFTFMGRGTSGYRAPELLVGENGRFNNKVDIWALGCILHELITWEKPFSSDAQAVNYAESKMPLEIKLSRDFSARSRASISSTIHDMLQIEPSSRPSASHLYDQFCIFYQRVPSGFDNTSEPTTPKNNLVFPDPNERWPRVNEKPSWVDYNSKDIVVFQEIPPGDDDLEQPPTSGGITKGIALHTVVNTLNMRVCTVSHNEEDVLMTTKLWTTSGRLIWQKDEPISSNGKLVWPIFSEDGNYLAVYSQDCVEVIDARRAKTVKLISIYERELNNSTQTFHGTAISITGRAERLAMSTEISSPEISDSGASLGRWKFPQQGERKAEFVDIIMTTFLADVAIAYLAAGEQILALGKTVAHVDRRFNSLNLYSLNGFCWDVNTRTLLKHFAIGDSTSYRESALCYMTVASQPRIVIRVSNMKGPVESNIFIFSRGGLQIAKFCGDSMVHGTVPDGVIVLQYDGHIHLGNAKSQELRKIAIIEGDELPDVGAVRWLVASERRLTLILKDERFVLFGRD